MSDPSLSEQRRQELVDKLMDARRQVAVAKRSGDEEGERNAHRLVNSAKEALGERGHVWWTDSMPDYNRHMARNTPYAEWYAGLDIEAG
ncbi:hypothetical protein [Sphingobium sp.]|uniref:hypothetical protein n=1 Tax=Sphingobium sp. TaxID=1912891 RepID=UPI00345B9EC1